MNAIAFKLYNPFSQFDEVKAIWTSFSERCPHPYYLSWAWIEFWLENIPPDCSLFLVVGYIDGSPNIAMFLSLHRRIKDRFFRLEQCSLNQSLIPHIDVATYIEHNSVLIDPGLEIHLETVLKLIPVQTWDEFSMVRSSLIFQPNLILGDEPNKRYELNIEKEDCYYVDLEKVRRNNNDYLSLLSQNRRQQIRRSIKEYEKLGEIDVRVAKTKEEALDFFDEFVKLHQKSWSERGFPGAMSTEFTINYHKNFISKRFENGEIQLMRTSAGNHTLGYLYHFIYDGRVYFNLSGFNYLPGNIYRPGLVCHYYAIIYNAELGLNFYDFMAGKHEYKKSLSTDGYQMQSIQVQKRNIKYYANKLALKLYLLYKKCRKVQM
ncbi:MAG: GNAT family N-acetyltransferase [Thermodesulfobacteriota bacterium]|nr:GNAT family N-acetyltransferase [Candidatus Dadabacteria bacterium]